MLSLVCVAGPTTNESPTNAVRRIRSIYPLSFVLAALVLTMLPSLACAPNVPNASHIGQVCFAVADERDLGPQDPDNDQDTLTLLDPATGETQVIGTTGTHNVEALSFGPHRQLYAADGGQIGIVNPTTGKFTKLPQPLGTAGGAVGEFHLNDSDGLAFSLDHNILFGTQRRFDGSASGPKPDLLFAIDPTTGAHIPDFFGPQGGPKTDYVVVPPVMDDENVPLNDIDDIQFNPVTGILYAVMNTDGRSGVLVTIDINTGLSTPIATFRNQDEAPPNNVIDDVEGISFSNDGTLYASTGDNYTGDFDDLNTLFDINITTGLGKIVGPFPKGPKDYEGVACLSLEAAIVLKKSTNGPGQAPDDADTPTGPQIKVGSPVTWTYTFTNTGVLTLTNLSLIDDPVGTIGPNNDGSCLPATFVLGPGIGYSCVAVGIAQAGQYTNTATITGDTMPDDFFPAQTISDTNPSHYFGVGNNSALGDFIWYDSNANGIQDGGEQGVANIPVTLLDGACSSALGQTKSNQAGLYSFANLAPGSYCVHFDISSIAGDYAFSPQDAGGNDATDSDAGANGKTIAVTLAPNQSNLTLDAGVVKKSLTITAEGLCIKDAPYVRYTVTPVNFTPGNNPVTIRFLDIDNDAELAKLEGQPLSNTLLWPGAAVDANGAGAQWPGWKFENGQWVQIPTDLRPEVKLEFSVNPTNVTTVTYPPSNPTCSTDPRASLGDRVWVDSNQNGIQDAGEANVTAIKVTLLDSNNQPVGEALTTDANGNYLFTGLYPGVYSLLFDKNSLPPSFVFTLANANENASDTATDSDADSATGKTVAVPLEAGQIYLDLDAGIYAPSNPQLAALGDTVWFDVNRNGLQDGDEVGVPNVQVLLHKADSTIVATQTTNSAGKYLFSDLQPGSYFVEFATLQGYSYTHHDLEANSHDAADSDARVPWIDLSISDGGKDAELGKPLVFTLFYTNTEAIAATNLVISKTVPEGSSLDDVANPGWECGGGTAAGNVCTFALANLGPNQSGSKSFTIKLKAVEAEVPDLLDFLVSFTNGTPALTANVTLAAGETNLSVDGGLVLLRSSLTVATPTGPTDLPVDQQPQQENSLFLPSLRSQ